MSSEAIKKELQIFNSSIKKLSSGIGKASVLWGDAKFAELSSSISVIANQSKDVIMSGEKCCSSIDNFSKIASEKY